MIDMTSTPRRSHRLLAGLLSFALALPAQQAPAGQAAAPPAGAATGSTSRPMESAIPEQAQKLRLSYTISVGDQLLIRAENIEEIGERPFRVQDDGTVILPVPNSTPVKAAGRTIEDFENDLKAELKKFFRDPSITVSLVGFNTPPVFMVGAFKNPGVKSVAPKMSLIELLTREGGLAPNASRRIRVIRKKESGAIPLKAAVDSADGRSSYVEISIDRLQTAINPEEDIVLQPFDVITVERAEMVYFLGTGVVKTGPVPLEERKTLSMLQAFSLAGGAAPGAKLKKAYILRPIGNTAQRAEIAIDLSRVVRGEVNDFPLHPNDVVYVPGASGGNRAALLQQIATTLTTGVITALVVRSVRR